MNHSVTFRRNGRGKARCKPNPEYPNGIALDASAPDSLTCSVELPYPAPECGWWEVRCRECTASVAITAAGRPDDPVSVRISCAWNNANLPSKLTH